MTPKTNEDPCQPEEKMSLNCSDQVFIKRLFDRQDDVLQDFIEARITALQDKVAEVIKGQNEVFFEEIRKHDIRITALEKYMSLRYTAVRVGLGIFIGISIVFVILRILKIV